MSTTLKTADPLKPAKNESADKKANFNGHRKITLTRPAEKAVSEKDSTDIATAMAATLCHQINNPLMTITAITEVLLGNHKELSPDIIEKINGIAIAAERIKIATHKLISLDSLQYCETAASRMILTDDSDDNSNNRLTQSNRESSE